MDNKLELEDELDELKVAEFFNEYEDYIISELIPEAVAKYLSMGYFKDFLSPCPIKNHINSAIDIFSLECNVEIILPKIEEILSTKYNLRIADYKLSKLEKVNK